MNNPLESYRRTQRELRRNFEAFTRANCPTCPTPCCRRPARIAPSDILLAEATGWRAKVINKPAELQRGGGIPEDSPLDAIGADEIDMVAATATRMMDALSGGSQTESDATTDTETGSEPCEYLATTGCTFPADLRPFGCTTYVCKYMYARMDRPTLTKTKRLVRELEDRHTALMRTLRHLTTDDEE